MTTQDTGPLDWRIGIVDKSGRPTQEFMRKWATQRTNNGLIGFVTVGSGAPSGTPQDGQEYVDVSSTPYVLYVGDNGSWTAVGITKFIQLSDVPNSYTGQSGKLVQVNGGETALEFSTVETILDSVGNTQGDILYRSTSGWTVLAPGTAGYVLSTGGTGADPSWIAAGGGGGSGHVPLTDGIPVALPALSTFSWMNQGSASATQHTNGPISMAIPLQGGDQLRGLQQAVPGSTPWTLTAKMSGFLWSTNYCLAGLHIIDGSGKLVTWHVQCGAATGGIGLEFNHWNSNTSFSGNPFNDTLPKDVPIWLRINNDGTNFNCSVSENGADWIAAYSESNTSFIGTPVTAGVFGDNNSGGGLQQSTMISIWSWELVTGSGTDSTWP